MVSGSIGTVSSGGMVAGLVSLEDSRRRGAGVLTDTGIMYGEVVERSGSAEKHSI